MASSRLLVLDFVRGYIGRHRASPSVGEISAALSTNPTRIKRAIRSLVRAGMLLRAPGPRGLRLPEARDEALRLLAELGHALPGAAGLPSGAALPVLDYLPDGDE